MRPLLVIIDNCIPQTQIIDSTGAMAGCSNDQIMGKGGSIPNTERKISHPTLPSCWAVFPDCSKGHIFKTRLKVKLNKIK